MKWTNAHFARMPLHFIFCQIAALRLNFSNLHWQSLNSMPTNKQASKSEASQLCNIYSSFDAERMQNASDCMGWGLIENTSPKKYMAQKLSHVQCGQYWTLTHHIPLCVCVGIAMRFLHISLMPFNRIKWDKSKATEEKGGLLGFLSVKIMQRNTLTHSHTRTHPMNCWCAFPSQFVVSSYTLH